MAAFLLALFAALLASLGGRDQRLVAHLSVTLGPGLPLLAICWLVSALTAALAGAAGQWLALTLPGAVREWAAALVLLLAAAKLARPIVDRPAREPTRSLFAIGVVLFLRQAADAPRLAIAAIALASGLPLHTAAGGALGGGMALTLGWAARPDGEGPRAAGFTGWRSLRIGGAGLLLIAAIWAVLSL